MPNHSSKQHSANGSVVKREHSQELLCAAKGFVSVEGGRGGGFDKSTKTY